MKAWLSDREECDICGRDISPNKVDCFVDGKTTEGPWALMCPVCYVKHGVGLGMGLGQLYSGDEKAELLRG